MPCTAMMTNMAVNQPPLTLGAGRDAPAFGLLPLYAERVCRFFGLLTLQNAPFSCVWCRFASKGDGLWTVYKASAEAQSPVVRATSSHYVTMGAVTATHRKVHCV